jgi:DNA-binding response OmpR family regulator
MFIGASLVPFAPNATPPQATQAVPAVSQATAERRSPARVLIVESRERIARVCLETLQKVERLEPRVVPSGSRAMQHLGAWHPQLIVIGDELAGECGLQLCSQIREEWSVPVIIVAKQADMKRQIQCLNTGADDCIVFPFEAPLFVARLLCLLRRAYRYSVPPLATAPRGALQFHQPGPVQK